MCEQLRTTAEQLSNRHALIPTLPDPSLWRLTISAATKGMAEKKAQNSVKNNFCPEGDTAAEITIARTHGITIEIGG